MLVSPLRVDPVHVIRAALPERHVERLCCLTGLASLRLGKAISTDQFLCALIEFVYKANVDVSRCRSVDEMVALLAREFRKYPQLLRRGRDGCAPADP